MWEGEKGRGPANGRSKNDPIRVAVLGSTGSIGTQTLEIARLFPDRIKIVALTAGQNVELLARQAKEFNPECVVVGSGLPAERAKGRFDCPVFSGRDELVRAATWDRVDVVVTAVVGSVGLIPTVAAVKQGCRVALANKETMVVAGDLVAHLAARHGADIIPVDSEHSAIYQCLTGESSSSISRLILTASGGPFRERPLDSFHSITIEEALDHPNWDMGPKITVDSATMMNKGLEVIEARWLFDIPPEKIDVVIHPQSIIHSMVEFIDGSTKAQLGPPDMKVPIQYALSAPGRWQAPHATVPWDLEQNLTFARPEAARYPCLEMAFEALRLGGAHPAVMNAANEVAVDLFISGRIPYDRIPSLVGDVLARGHEATDFSIDARMESDRMARRTAMELAGVGSH